MKISASVITKLPKAPVFHVEDCNCLNDVLFKYLFGRPEHKAFTIDLLNTFLAEELGHEITDLTFAPQEMAPDSENGKETRFDVACKLDGGENVDIEVQMLDQQNMKQRSLYYWASRYYHKLGKGDGYRSLVPMITLNILNFVLFDDIPSPFTSWAVYERQTHQRFHQDLSLNFLEIPKFAKQLKLGKPLSRAERWMCYFSNDLTMSEKWEALQGDDLMTQAMTVANDFFNNPEEFRRYQDRELYRMDRESERRGLLEKGLEQGLEQGIIETQESMVRTVLGKLHDIAKVADLLDLDLKEVRRIAAKFGLLH